MKISELVIKGAYLIETEPVKDFRGSFARQFCKKELAKFGIDFNICQCNISKNPKAGTLRGMHYQKEPFPEIKMVSCLQGRIFDCIIDLRKDSPTYLKWMAEELSSENNKMIYKYQIKRMETDYDTKGPGNAFKLRKYTAEGFL